MFENIRVLEARVLLSQIYERNGNGMHYANIFSVIFVFCNRTAKYFSLRLLHVSIGWRVCVVCSSVALHGTSLPVSHRPPTLHKLQTETES